MSNALRILNRTLALSVLSMLVFSCNQSTKVPFPKDLLELPQPEAKPLNLAPGKPIHWDTLGKGKISPKIFSLNFSKLPSKDYDTSGFKPFSAAPTTKTFDYASLPSKAIDLKNTPWQPLNMKVGVLPIPARFPATKPVNVNSPLDMLSWRQLMDMGATVTSVFRNNEGLLWIGTWKGLYRYDGITLEAMVPKAQINKVIGDRDGNIWYTDIGIGATPGIYCLNPGENTLSFKKIDTVAFRFGMTLSKDGMIWITDVGNIPLIRINPQDMTYQRFGKEVGMKTLKSYKVATDHNNRLWLTSQDDGLGILDPATNSIRFLSRKNGLGSDTTFVVIEGPDEKMWVALRGGIEAIDMKQQTITYYAMPAPFRQLSLLFDQTGLLWVSSLQGIFVLDIKNQKMRHIGSEEGINPKTTFSLTQNNQGNILASTLSYSSSISGPIYIIRQQGKTAHFFNQSTIISTTQDQSGKIWAGTENELYVIDQDNKQLWRMDSTHGLANNYVQSITRQDGKIFITTDGGYNLYDPKNNQLERVTPREGLRTDTVYSLLTDRQGGTWTTGVSTGIDRYDAANQLFLRLTSKGGLSDDFVATTLQAKSGKIWVATYQGGVDIIDPTTQTIQILNDSSRLGGFSYKAMMEDSRGHIWVSTDKGVFMINPQKETITQITTREGLSNNTVWSLLEYNESIIAGTNSKITIITPPRDSATGKWQISIMDHSADISKKAASFVSDAITKNGDYLWGDEGLTILHGIQPDTTTFPAVITGIRMMGKPVYFGAGNPSSIKKESEKNDSISTPILDFKSAGYTLRGDCHWDSLAGAYELPVNFSVPNQNNYFQFQFGNISTGRLDTMRYTYMLEGIDQNWTTTSQTSSENY